MLIILRMEIKEASEEVVKQGRGHGTIGSGATGSAEEIIERLVEKGNGSSKLPPYKIRIGWPVMCV
jgi:hypothetical protein